MKLDLSTEPDHLKQGEPFKVEVLGMYLYGAPASGNRIKAVLNTYRDRHPLKALPEFFFGNDNESIERRRIEIADAKLDDQGRTTIETVPSPPGPAPMMSAISARIIADLYETGGRPVTRSIQRTVWPAGALVGIRPLFEGEYAESNSFAEFEVVKAATDGTLSAAEGLDVTLIREERDYFWSYDESRGWHYEYTESPYPVHRDTIDIPEGKSVKIEVPVEYGSYRIEIADPETNLKLVHRFEAGWNWRDRMGGTARPDKVNLILDKPAYRTGETASVKIVPPHPGFGIVTVEGDRRLWSKRLHIPEGGTVVEIPIDPKWNRHDLYVGAVVFRPGTAKEKITPNRAVGLAHLPLERSDRKLSVRMDAPTEMRPGRDLEVDLTIEGLAGQEASVTVAAVDVGILNITNFKTPDPFGHFFAKRRYQPSIHDLYGKVIENLDGVRSGLRFGGDIDSKGLRSGKRPQAKVMTVALFSGPVTVGRDGSVKVSLPVPDFNGSLRIMAAAFSKDKFGFSEREVVVASPVVAEIAMPRFLAPGDESVLTLDLRNLSGIRQDLNVSMTAKSPLSMTSVSDLVSLDDGQMKTLRFPLSTEEVYGVGRIDLAVTGNDVDLARNWELGVRPAYPGERRVTRSVLKSGDAIRLDKLSANGLMKSTVEAEVIVSDAPPLNVREALKGLLGYPYGCLEQTTSQAFPLLFVDSEKALSVGIKPLSYEERLKRLEVAMSRLGGMQLPGGGFGLWSNTGMEENWLGPYVVDFLLEAKDRGFRVPEEMLQKALVNLQKRLLAGPDAFARPAYSESPAHLQFASSAYAAYVLARVGRAPLGTLRTLYDNQRKKARSGLPLVHLGLALKLQGDTRRSQAALLEGVGKTRNEKRYLGDYGSDVRDTGMILALLGRHGIDIEGGDDLIFRLGNELANRRYLSTQERLAVFLAAETLGERTGKSWSAILKIGEDSGRTLVQGRYRSILAYEALEKTVILEAETDFPLYAETEVSGYPVDPPKPQSDKISISRSLYDPKGNPVGRRALSVGELLIVHLRLEGTENIENALVVDLLPAGMETENLNLTQGETLNDMTVSGVSPAQAMSSQNIKHQEFRDDRYVAALRLPRSRAAHLFYMVRVVSPGVFTAPPPYVEDMYRPEIRGVGESAGRVTVTR